MSDDFGYVPLSAFAIPNGSQGTPAESTNTSPQHDDNEFGYVPQHLLATPTAEKKQNEKYPLPDGVAAALAGGAAGLMFGGKSDITGNGIASKLAEKLYGAPYGSIEAWKNAQSPNSYQSLLQQVAEKYVPDALSPLSTLGSSERVEPTLAPKSNIPVTAQTQSARANNGATSEEGVTGRQGVSAFNDTTSRQATGAKLAEENSLVGKKEGYLPRSAKQELARIDMNGVTPDGIAVSSDVANQLAAEKQNRNAIATATANQASADAENERIKTAAAERMASEKAVAERTAAGAKIGSKITSAENFSTNFQNTLRTLSNFTGGAFGVYEMAKNLMDANQNIMDPKTGKITKKGLDINNVLGFFGGAGTAVAIKNPAVGLPAAGVGFSGQAINDMRKNGVSLNNAASLASGVGIGVMNKSPMVGTALQIPAAGLALHDYLVNNRPSPVSKEQSQYWPNSPLTP